MLYYGAGACCPAAVSILLEATESARDSDWRTPHEVIGSGLRRDGVQMYREKAAAIRRMLGRGSAYRARSWAWPSDEEAATDGGSGGDTDDGSGGDTAAAAAVLSSPPAGPKPPPVARVRIFWPKDKSSSKFFVWLVRK